MTTLETEQRHARFTAALLRVRKTGSPAARSELRDARLSLEAHGEMTEQERTERNSENR